MLFYFSIGHQNQQFTARNLTFNNAKTAVFANWNWGWTFQGLTINNAQVPELRVISPYVATLTNHYSGWL